MHELIVNRSQPEVDPVLHAWAWQIPVDLFFAAVVSGMMILSGIALLASRRSEREGGHKLGVHAPLLAFVLVHICLIALFLDLSHKLYVWNLYLSFQPRSPMSWGSWLLTLVYLVLVATSLVTLPAQWPWLAQRVPPLARISAWLCPSPRLCALAWANIALGIGLALYTGVLLATMVARPLWNTMVLPPLFLVSGLAGGAAVAALAARFVPVRAAPKSMLGGFVNALIGATPGNVRRDEDSGTFARLALVFLAAQAILLALFVIALATGTASQIAALQIVLTGRFAPLFWLVVAAGIVVPIAVLMIRQRSALAPAALVLLLAGGLALRWVLVDAGQATRLAPVLGFGS